MAWTQQDLDNLEAAMATGAKRVKYADKEIEYNSWAEMLAARNLIREELGLNTQPKMRLASYNKGVYPEDNQCK